MSLLSITTNAVDNADAVIGAQCRAIRLQGAAVPCHLDRVDIEVMNSILVLHIPCRGAPVGEPSVPPTRAVLAGVRTTRLPTSSCPANLTTSIVIHGGLQFRFCSSCSSSFSVCENGAATLSFVAAPRADYYFNAARTPSLVLSAARIPSLAWLSAAQEGCRSAARSCRTRCRRCASGLARCGWPDPSGSSRALAFNSWRTARFSSRREALSGETMRVFSGPLVIRFLADVTNFSREHVNSLQ